VILDYHIIELLPPFFNIRRRSIPRSKKFRHGNFSSFQLYPPCRVGVSLLSLRLCRSLSLPSIAAHPWPSSLPSLPPLSPPPPFSVLESHLASHHHVITRRNHLLSQSKVVLWCAWSTGNDDDAAGAARCRPWRAPSTSSRPAPGIEDTLWWEGRACARRRRPFGLLVLASGAGPCGAAFPQPRGARFGCSIPAVVDFPGLLFHKLRLRLKRRSSKGRAHAPVFWLQVRGSHGSVGRAYVSIPYFGTVSNWGCQITSIPVCQ
jgi:hypothetical protein